MTKYKDIIESSLLIEKYDSCLTTGDIEYEGTALEIMDQNGEEIFHIVVDNRGVLQVLMFPRDEPFRLDLDMLIEIMVNSKGIVRKYDFD
ncbi:hypothetical protein [Kiloniella laminariae]|uniref:hypothetical protein n=1 Tax=Kiloniella laminariae TaxID=454162 RepID=UPI000374B5EA|nr:hypothetical protein [Kiloniella laminariae]